MRGPLSPRWKAKESFKLILLEETNQLENKAISTYESEITISILFQHIRHGQNSEAFLESQTPPPKMRMCRPSFHRSASQVRSGSKSGLSPSSERPPIHPKDTLNSGDALLLPWHKAFDASGHCGCS